MTEELPEHFIVVRVKYDPNLASGIALSPVGRVRQAIHDVAEEHDYALADIVLPAHKTHDLLSRSIRSDYLIAKALFDRTTKEITSILSLRPKTEPLTQEQKDGRAKIRSLRQARDSVIRISRHIEKYGAVGLENFVPAKKGRHAK